MYLKKLLQKPALMLSSSPLLPTFDEGSRKRTSGKILALILFIGLDNCPQAAESLLGWLEKGDKKRVLKQEKPPSLSKDVVAVPVERLQPSRKVNGEPHAVDPERLARLQQLAPKDRLPIDIDIHRHELHIHNGHHRVAAAKAEGIDFVRAKPMNPIALPDAPRNVHGRPVLINQAGPAVNPALKKEPWRPKRFGRK